MSFSEIFIIGHVKKCLNSIKEVQKCSKRIFSEVKPIQIYKNRYDFLKKNIKYGIK